ncbi:MAG: LysM peptidoglycan-binding domain-containing protein [Clostridiales bacterium]|nr:LysM peptidoglycan-binding domain-containing protein [Clostridiales bacterium]
MADNRNRRDQSGSKTNRTPAADKIAEQRRRRNSLESLDGPRLNSSGRNTAPRLSQSRNQDTRRSQSQKKNTGSKNKNRSIQPIQTLPNVYSKQKAPQKPLFGRLPKGSPVTGGRFLAGFIVVILVCCALFSLTNKNAVEVFVDGASIGVVIDKSYNADNIEEICRQKLVSSLGTNVEVTSTIETKKVHASKNDENVGTGDYIIKTTTDSLSYNVEACTIIINGTEMAVVASNEVAQTVVDRILSEHSLSYIDDISSVIEGPLIDGLEYGSKYIDGTEIMSTDQAYEVLSGTKSQQLTYTVQSGDSFGKIASIYGLTVSELSASNPSITDTTRISVGDELTINATVPIIDIKVVTQTIDRSSGTAVIVKTTYINGVETDSSSIDSSVASGDVEETTESEEEAAEE